MVRVAALEGKTGNLEMINAFIDNRRENSSTSFEMKMLTHLQLTYINHQHRKDIMQVSVHFHYFIQINYCKC